MDLGLTETQQMLKTSARNFLETECSTDYVRDMEHDHRGYSTEMWAKMSQQGWLGLIIPENYGGVGFDFQDLTILLEEMGRHMLPGPFFSTTVLGCKAIMEGGNAQQREEYLPQIADGQLLVTFALTEPSAGWNPSDVFLKSEDNGNGYTLNGTKLFVPNANVSDFIIVVARTGKEEKDISLYMCPTHAEGITLTTLNTVASDKQSEVVFEDVLLPYSSLLGDLNKGWETVYKVLQWGAVGKCAEMVGGAQQVLDMTVEYAKQRTQFGRPIGTFQAIQHHCANMATDVEGSRLVTYQASWLLSEGIECNNQVATAKAWVSDAYQRICALGHQSHGAIGFTKEHDMQLLSRRAKAAELFFGDTDYHLELVAKSMNL